MAPPCCLRDATASCTVRDAPVLRASATASSGSPTPGTPRPGGRPCAESNVSNIARMTSGCPRGAGAGARTTHQPPVPSQPRQKTPQLLLLLSSLRSLLRSLCLDSALAFFYCPAERFFVATVSSLRRDCVAWKPKIGAVFVLRSARLLPTAAEPQPRHGEAAASYRIAADNV